VRHHELYSPWLPQENWRPGFQGFRGAVAPDARPMRNAVTEIKGILTEAGVGDEPVGLDIVEPPFLFAMQRQGLTVADALLRPIPRRTWSLTALSCSRRSTPRRTMAAASSVAQNPHRLLW
jgi:hypothetical protein